MQMRPFGLPPPVMVDGTTPIRWSEPLPLPAVVAEAEVAAVLVVEPRLAEPPQVVLALEPHRLLAELVAAVAEVAAEAEAVVELPQHRQLLKIFSVLNKMS